MWDRCKRRSSIVTICLFFFAWVRTVSSFELFLLFFPLEELVSCEGIVPFFCNTSLFVNLYSIAELIKYRHQTLFLPNNKEKNVRTFTRLINHELNKSISLFVTIIGHKFKYSPQFNVGPCVELVFGACDLFYLEVVLSPFSLAHKPQMRHVQ